jgi:hypothetical protein
MARIRTTKPEFWTSEQIVECSRDARLLFIGMWNFCDDGGVMKDSPRRIKMEVFPADDLDSSSIRRLIDELVSNGLLHIYEVGNTSYIKVLGWHHQNIDRPNYRFPQPNGEIPKSKDHFQAIHSATTRRAFDDQSPPEGSGREGKGTTTTTPLSPPTENPSPENSHPVYRWNPGTETLNAIRKQGVPDKFIDEQTPEFRAYWAARHDRPLTYDAKFIASMTSSWRRTGHSWSADPPAGPGGKRNPGPSDFSWDFDDEPKTGTDA